MSQRTYATARDFKQALTRRINDVAIERGLPATTVRRDFVHGLYLARLFEHPHSNWLLKGGAGILMRVHNARHSRDLDLADMNEVIDVERSIQELQDVGGPSEMDPFTMVVTRSDTAILGTNGATLRVEVFLDDKPFDAFPIDMVVDQHIIGGIDEHTVSLPVIIDDVAPMPSVRLYPLEDQIADKVLAMYEIHGRQQIASTRYRDLVDLVLLTSNPATTLNTTDLRQALHLGAAARHVTVPHPLASPGPSWPERYRAAATAASLPPDLGDLDTALAHVTSYLGPALEQPDTTTPMTRGRFRNAVDALRSHPEQPPHTDTKTPRRRDDDHRDPSTHTSTIDVER